MIQKEMLRFIFISLLTGASQLALGQDSLLKIMKDELLREKSAFAKAELPPYYIDYRITNINEAQIKTSFGSLIESQSDKSRILISTVKVGDYALDNTHPTERPAELDFLTGRGGSSPSIISFENDTDAISYALWRSTQKEYKTALDSYKQVKVETENAAKKPTTADFSKEEPSQYFEAPLPEFDKFFNRKEWEDKLAAYSKPFLANADIVSGEASMKVITERKYFVSTEGSEIAHNMTYAHLYINATIRADDGDVLPLYKSYFAFIPDHLPSSELILKDVQDMITKLDQLKKAPVAEPYTGPAILHALSAGVFFHEIFGHRIEGHRLRTEHDAQTFKSKVHEQVLPASINITFDPTQFQYNGSDLNGSYRFDDEGVKSRRVNVVEKGILNTFLMSRSPLKGFANSNGHGRASPGNEAVSRQSNMIVESDKAVTDAELRKMLINECKKQNKSYGYMFKDVTGGFTNTDRYSPNAFNIMPTEVYRIYTDGRPDELVRGVDLIGTPLSMFAEIEATGDKKEIFTGYCGAESGNVPVSAVAPSLFVRRIETQKKPKLNLQSPLLSRPALKNNLSN